SFSQMAGENAQSRIYLGIHWQFDAIEGIRCGDGIADYAFTHALLPLHGPRPVALASMRPTDQIRLAVKLEDAAANGGVPTTVAVGSRSAGTSTDQSNNSLVVSQSAAVPAGQPASAPAGTGRSSLGAQPTLASPAYLLANYFHAMNGGGHSTEVDS